MAPGSVEHDVFQQLRRRAVGGDQQRLPHEPVDGGFGGRSERHDAMRPLPRRQGPDEAADLLDAHLMQPAAGGGGDGRLVVRQRRRLDTGWPVDGAPHGGEADLLQDILLRFPDLILWRLRGRGHFLANELAHAIREAPEQATPDVVRGAHQGDHEAFLDAAEHPAQALVRQRHEAIEGQVGGRGQSLPVMEAVLAAEHVLRLLEGHIVDGVTVGQTAQVGASSGGCVGIASDDHLVQLLGLVPQMLEAGTGGKRTGRHGSPSFRECPVSAEVTGGKKVMFALRG